MNGLWVLVPALLLVDSGAFLVQVYTCTYIAYRNIYISYCLFNMCLNTGHVCCGPAGNDGEGQGRRRLLRLVL